MTDASITASRPFPIDLVSAPKNISAGLIVGAIGVVYGDIGTSVLYAVKEVFGHGHVPFTVENVYGILSMFFWKKNRANRITSVSGMTYCVNRGDTTSRPSTADSTEMAGVMTPSP